MPEPDDPRRAEIHEADQPVGPDEPGAAEKYEADQPVKLDKRSGGAILRWSLGLGIVSLFFGGTFGLLPIATVVVSVIALANHRGQRGAWRGWLGLIFGIAYTLVYMNNYGYLG